MTNNDTARDPVAKAVKITEPRRVEGPATLTVRLGTWAEMRRAILLHAVARHGSIRAAARKLDVIPSTFWRWIKELRKVDAAATRPGGTQ